MFPKSLSSINKSMKTILQQLSFKALGTCWWQWDLFFFPVTDFIPLYVSRDGTFHTEKCTDSAPSIKNIPRKDSWTSRICLQGMEQLAQIPAVTGATWASPDVTVTQTRPSRWTSVLPTHVPPWLLSTPPNHQPESAEKSNVHSHSWQLCAHQMWGPTWAEQKITWNVLLYVQWNTSSPHPSTVE